MRYSSWKVFCSSWALSCLTACLAQAAAPSVPQSLITAKYYNDIGSGTTMADLTNSVKWPDKPDSVIYLPYFEINATGDIATAPAADSGKDNYGVQVEGYFYPDTTGDFTFYLSADDQAQLYLSTDDTAANKKLIAVESAWSNPRQYDVSAGSSDLTAKRSDQYAATQWGTKDAANGGAKITLTKGKAYYIQALMKEGGGGDVLSVSVDGANPIPGEMLATIDKQTGSASIKTQPQSQTVAEGSPVSLTVEANGTPPFTYQWTRNGNDITDATNYTYSIARVPFTENGAKFAAKVTGAQGGEVTSQTATLTVTADTTAPALKSVTGALDFIKVIVAFSEPVEKTSAETVANYTIQGLTVTSATVDPVDDSKVGLITSKQTEGAAYTVVVKNVKDQAVTPNTIAANSQKTFHAFSYTGTGFVVIEYFDGMGFGASVSSLDQLRDTIDTLVPNRTQFNTTAESLSWENGANYGARMQGYLVPPETGSYVFHIASDDQSYLYLSTDESPANLSADPICQITGWTNQRDWANTTGGTTDDTLNLSSPVNLTKGKKYFFRAFQVEGGGGDGLALGWELPSASGTTVVIPGSAVLTALSSDNAVITITKQPASTQIDDNKTVTLQVVATGSSDYGSTLLYQWQKNGVDIAGATSSTYTTPKLTVADSGVKYAVVISVPGKSVTIWCGARETAPDQL